MDRWRDFAPATGYPTTWTDGIESLLGNYVGPNFQLLPDPVNHQQIQCVAGTGVDAVCIAVRGKPRWISAPAVASHPGGAAGPYDVFAATTNDAFATLPGPPAQEQDQTDHAFWLQILPVGSTPAATLYRKIGQCYWDGAVVVAVTTLVGPFASRAPVVTALPKNPPDGLTVHLVAAAITSSTRLATWRMRWWAAASKWAFVGGPSAASSAGGTTLWFTTDTLGVPKATACKVTAPAAGDYDIEMKAELDGSTQGQLQLAPVGGGLAFNTNNMIQLQNGRAVASRIVRAHVGAGDVTLYLTNVLANSFTISASLLQVGIRPHYLDPV